ncbi:MAG: hypothetical protein ACT4PL_00745 [Phycisphaerales bacterium]
MTNLVQGYPQTTNADRAEEGITLRGTSTSDPAAHIVPVVSNPPEARMTGQYLLRIVIVAIVVAVVVVLVFKLLGIQQNAAMVAAIVAGVTAGPMALMAMRKKDAK